MALKPWYNVITPPEYLRERRPLDASELAVHLDQVRERRAPPAYQNAADYFGRTFLTTNLSGPAADVIRLPAPTRRR